MLGALKLISSKPDTKGIALPMIVIPECNVHYFVVPEPKPTLAPKLQISSTTGQFIFVLELAILGFGYHFPGLPNGGQ